MTRITPSESTPLYRSIFTDLEQQILSGRIVYGEQLPVLPELCRQYGVSEAPVRRALDELERAGLIVRRRGRGQGTFAIKRQETFTIRLLLVEEFDVRRSPIQLVHEVFDLRAGIEAAAQGHGMPVLVVDEATLDSLPEPSPETGYLIIAQTWEGYRRGIQLATRFGEETPYVLVNPPQRGLPSVRVDMEAAAHAGVRHLMDQGHRRIAYVGGTGSEWSRPRLAGYRRALTEAQIASDDALVIATSGVDPGEDAAALDRLLALPSPPTALFASSDYRALHLLEQARREQISLPAQVSLCGYDDIGAAAAVRPALTTVRHPRYELGAPAVELLCRLLSGENVPEAEQDVLVAPYVIVRESTGPVSRLRNITTERKGS